MRRANSYYPGIDMTLPYPKPYKTYEELVGLITDVRGLGCQSKGDLVSFLTNNNYYRFTGYARQWQVKPARHDDKFVEGAAFEQIQEMMKLDHSLRHLLFEQISFVETAIRTRFAHILGKDYGSSAFYLDPDFYNEGNVSNGNPIDVPKEILSDLRRSKSPMIFHYRHVEESDKFHDLPIWVAVEVLSFGKIAKMIAQLKEIAPAKELAQDLQVQWRPFASVIHSFTVLRNMCAHHSQLWHRPLPIQCPVSKSIRHQAMRSFSNNSIYAAIIMVNYYRFKIDGDTLLKDKINALIDSNKDFQRGICSPSPK